MRSLLIGAAAGAGMPHTKSFPRHVRCQPSPPMWEMEHEAKGVPDHQLVVISGAQCSKAFCSLSTAPRSLCGRGRSRRPSEAPLRAMVLYPVATTRVRGRGCVSVCLTVPVCLEGGGWGDTNPGPLLSEDFPQRCCVWWLGGGGGWHKASVLGCLPLAAPIGLSPLLILLGGWGGDSFVQCLSHWPPPPRPFSPASADRVHCKSSSVGPRAYSLGWGQVWTRHCAPAVPASTWPSLPSQFHSCATGH